MVAINNPRDLEAEFRGGEGAKVGIIRSNGKASQMWGGFPAVVRDPAALAVARISRSS